MGIRFLCEHCQRRLNVKDTQVGQYCLCPDCEKEILVPLASTIGPPMRRKKKRSKRKRRESTVDISSVAAGASAVDSVAAMPGSFQSVVEPVEKPQPLAAPVQESSSSLNGSISQLSSDVSPAKSEIVLPEPVTLDAEPKKLEIEDVAIGHDSDGDQGDSDSASDVLSYMEDQSDSDELAADESFLLSKPVTKIEQDPLTSDPNLIWYLRHRRLGEKGPLKAKQVEEMLRSGQLRSGAILWREDWNDWVAAEEVFPELAESQSKSTYSIPDELNPHSEASRKRRARKHYLMAFNAAAFLLVIVLVYWIATLVR